jgi:magnesium transporter
MATALLFERDSVGELQDWSKLPRLGRSAVLGIDLDEPDEADVEQLVEVLEVSEESRASLLDPSERPGLRDYDDYLQVTACAPTGDRGRKGVEVTCLVSRHWVVTAHAQPLEVLETFRERASASGDVGQLEGPEFLAHLLERVLESYFDAFEDIELVLEDIDASSMAGDHGAKDEVLSKLVAVRRDIGGLRRSLTAHREVMLSLTRPELEAITSSSAANRFATLRTRLEDAMQAARDSRDSVVGSFEILLAEHGPANQRDHEGADACVGADPARDAACRNHGDEFQAGALRDGEVLLGHARGDVRRRPPHACRARMRHWI